MIIVKNNIKDITKGCGVNNVSKDFAAELNKVVEDLIRKACKRAIENNRTTVMARDL